MTKRLPCPPAPGPLEAYAERFDACLGTLAQRRGFREYLQGLLLPRDRHTTLTGLVGTEPVVGAQAPSAQRLEGPPTELIAEHARMQDADLIALTTHGRSGVRGALFGRVAEAVILTAPCSLHIERVDEGMAGS